MASNFTLKGPYKRENKYKSKPTRPKKCKKMSLAQQILEVVLVRDRNANEIQAVERSTAEKAAQWPVVDEDKTKTKKISSFSGTGQLQSRICIFLPPVKTHCGWPQALTILTAAQCDPSGIVTHRTRTHQLTPGGARPQESKDTAGKK